MEGEEKGTRSSMYIVTAMVRNPLFPFHSTPAQIKIYGKGVGGGKKPKNTKKIKQKNTRHQYPTRTRTNTVQKEEKKTTEMKESMEREWGADTKGSGAPRLKGEEKKVHVVARTNKPRYKQYKYYRLPSPHSPSQCLEDKDI